MPRTPIRRIDRIPLFPLDVVLFPGELIELQIFEERYLLMTEELLADDLPVGVVLARQDEPDETIEHAPEAIGTAAMVIQAEQQDDGRWVLQAVGVRRFRILEVVSQRPYQEASVEWLDEEEGDPTQARELAEEILAQVEEMGGEVDRDSPGVTDPITVSHAVAAALPVDLATKQELLAAIDAVDRLDREAAILAR